MHELALAQAIVDIVEAQARKDRFTRVARIHLAIGRLALVEPEALTFGFEAVSRGTIAQGAQLAIERPPGTASCRECGQSVPLLQRGAACPRCGGFQLDVTGGDELHVTELEVA